MTTLFSKFQARWNPAAPAAAPADFLGYSGGLECLIAIARHHGIHLTKEQLVREHVLPSDKVTLQDIASLCARYQLKIKVLDLCWDDLSNIGKAFPAIVIMRDNSTIVLTAAVFDCETAHVKITDPSLGGREISIDRVRFEECWGGRVLLIKRSFDLSDEEQPFGIGLIASLVLRERRLVLDIAVAALALSLLSLAPIMFWRLLTDRVLPFYAYNTFALLCLMMVVVIVFETAFGSLRRYLLLRMTTRIDVKLWVYVFDKVLNLPIEYFESTPLGLVTHKISQMGRIRNFLTGQLFGTVLDSGVLLFFLPVMFMFSFTLTTIVLGMCLLIGAWIAFMLPPYRRRSGAAEHAEAARGAFLSQAIHGIRTVKSLSLEARHRHEWDVLTARIAKHRLAEGDFGNVIESVVRPLERFMISGTFALGVYLAMSTRDPVYVGSLFAFLMLSQRVVAPLIQAAQLIQQYDEARIAVGVVSSLVNQPEEEGRSGNGVKTSLRGHVEFQNVRFRYKGAINPALSAVTFDVPEGTTLGVMGRSGSGKTTITRLLQRLHSDYTGLIKLDGIDVREYDVDHLRASLGVVLQENFLFSGTIRENICAAKPDASFEQMVYAARLAGAEEFIDKLPRGYETFIYEGSPNLSGGQRQRLAIARALLPDPKILILDEATSALDAESEAIVNANIKRIAEGRSMITISHRLSSLVHSDAILVLDRGEVYDIGSHEALLGRCDIYAGLWHQQNTHAGADNRNMPRLVTERRDAASK